MNSLWPPKAPKAFEAFILCAAVVPKKQKAVVKWL
jgi:hypothetical protein